MKITSNHCFLLIVAIACNIVHAVNIPDHTFDFRGCSDGSTTADLDLKGLNLGLVATAINGASCSAYGMSFDGVNDYVDLSDWSWGGTQSWEVYAKFTTLSSYTRVFEFSFKTTSAASPDWSDTVLVASANDPDYGYSNPPPPTHIKVYQHNHHNPTNKEK